MPDWAAQEYPEIEILSYVPSIIIEKYASERAPSPTPVTLIPPLTRLLMITDEYCSH